MIHYEIGLVNFVSRFLPFMSKLLVIKKPYEKPAILVADLDGDGIVEIIAAYKLRGECYAVVIKNYNNIWQVAANIKGKGYDINYLDVAHIVDKKDNNLIIGWQVGGIWYNLNIFQWTPKGIENLVKGDMTYSKIEVENMPGKEDDNGKSEIALWKHDTGEAYNIEVLRWKEGKFTLALDVYPYYFKKVVTFYEEQVKKLPDAAFYWYHLADAELKAEMPEKALKSVHMAMKLVMKFNYAYPSGDDLIKLEKEILDKLQNRVIKLHPASLRTDKGIRWGYINDKGDFIIKPKYNNAYSFQDNGLAIIEESNLYGVIDEKGKYVVQPKYETINQFSEERATAVDKSGFKVIDEKGNEITSKAYPFIGGYNQGRALAANIGTEGEWIYGYLDKQGNEVIPFKYKSAGDFENDKTIVQIKEGDYALIDINGQILKTYKYPFVGNLGDGLLAFKQENEGKFGYIDEEGKVIISPRFTGVQPFSEGRAVVNTAEDYGNSYGLIDKKGDFLVKPQYNDIRLLGNNRAAIGIAISKENPRIGSRYAITDTNGKFLTDFIYYDVLNYSNGFASAQDGKYTLFIDNNGVISRNLPKVGGTGTLSFEGDLIKANIDMRLFYLSRSGKIVDKQNTVIPLNNQYTVREEKYKPNKDYLVYYPQVEGMKNKLIQIKVNNRLKELSSVKPVDSDIQLDYSYTGDFSIEFFKKNLLVIEFIGYLYYFGAAHGNPSRIYANLNLSTGRIYELKDLFNKNSNYVKVLSDIIDYQIKNNPEYSYIFPDSYKGINTNQPFYVKDDALYIYFDVYEIAPYAAGTPTFKIPFKDILNIIDINSEFWQAFN